MKKKTGFNTNNQQAPLYASFADHPAIDWIGRNFKNLGIGALVLFAALLLLYKATANQTIKAETNYIKAQTDFASFLGQEHDGKSDPEKQMESFNKLEAIIKSHPELHAKYDGMIAQIFISRNQINEAKPFAERTLKRISKNELPLYESYAKTTLLIGEGQYQEALKEANRLKSNMLENISSDPRHFGDTLFAYNLLRIAMLQQAADSPEGELAAWQEFKQYAQPKSEKSDIPQTISPEVFKRIINRTKEGNISLMNYIEEREKALKIKLTGKSTKTVEG